MKKLMLGNEAVARGLYESGCSFVSSYPGTPSTEITEEAAKYDEIYAEWAPNEKVAMESAFGASLAGKRTFCGMKHVGLNVAADPLFTISYTGVNGGMIIGVADDAGMHSSQNEQDSRHYARSAKLPMLEPSDSQEAIDFTKLAFELSEKYDTPCMLKMCTRVSHSQSIVETSDRVNVEAKPYEKNGPKYIMMPGFAKKRHPIVEERMEELKKFAELSDINKWEKGTSDHVGIVTSSTSYQYVKEVLGDQYSVLKLGMVWPLPDMLLKKFAKSVDQVVVVEELDGFIESYLKELDIDVVGKENFSLLGELSQSLVSLGFGGQEKYSVKLDEELPMRPPVMCAGCPHRGLFYTLSSMKLNVLGDIGCYTLGAVEPLNAIDATICMGASVSSMHGFLKASEDVDPERKKRTVAVIGDSTFMHSGMTGLANMAYNDSHGTLIILDNSITGMTGHQQNPTTGKNLKGDAALKIDLEALCHALGIERVRVVDPYDLKATKEAITEEINADEPSVIIARRPCALLKYVKHNPPLVCDHEKCVGCKACMKLGCPAINFDKETKKVTIDHTLCVGCNLCKQMCNVGAL